MDIQLFSKDYLGLLKNQFAGLNLTNILNEADFTNKQIYDSILPFEKSNVLRGTLNHVSAVLDVGFGGGFPLIPLALLNPKVSFLGVEATQKKLKAVEYIAKHFGLNNVQFLHSRIEDIHLDCKVLLTFKAVGPILRTLKLLDYSAEIQCGFYKGPNLEEQEGEQLNHVLKHWCKAEDILYTLPNNEARRFILFSSSVPPERRQSLDFKEKIHSNKTNERSRKLHNNKVKLSDILGRQWRT